MFGSAAMIAVLFSPTAKIARSQAISTSPESRRILSSSEALPLGRHFHHELAEILPLQQADQPLGRLLQARDDVLTIFHPALADPLRHLLVEGRALIDELALDEAADGEAPAQHLAHDHRQAVGPGIGRGPVVLRDQTAD